MVLATPCLKPWFYKGLGISSDGFGGLIEVELVVKVSVRVRVRVS